jgi:hypothetical protein
MNRTIMERERSIRLHVGLPLQFWADVVDTVVYLINRGPSSSLDGRIPEEEWTGKKVNYSFLKTFGCEAFVHIDTTEPGSVGGFQYFERKDNEGFDGCAGQIV